MERSVGCFSEDETNIVTTIDEDFTLFNKSFQGSSNNCVNDEKIEIKTENIYVSVSNSAGDNSTDDYSAQIDYKQSDNILDKININETELWETMTFAEDNIKANLIVAQIEDKIIGEKVPQKQQEFADLQLVQGEHSQIHSKDCIKYKMQMCNYCDNQFFRQDLFDIHMKTHTGNLVFMCRKCGKRFSLELEYEKHVKDMESNKCCFCSKIYVNRHSFRAHMKSHVNSYLCEYCGIKYSQLRILQHHLRIHRGSKEFQCKDCGKAFFDQDKLHSHVKIHSKKKRFLCGECPAAYRQENQLIEHLRRHTTHRFQCRYCSKVSKRRGDLTVHERIHTGERPFKCRQCNAAFVQQANLSYHSQKYGH